jgi:hypothetical protein
MLQYLIFLQQTESVIEVEVNLNVVECRTLETSRNAFSARNLFFCSKGSCDDYCMYEFHLLMVMVQWMQTYT